MAGGRWVGGWEGGRKGGWVGWGVVEVVSVSTYTTAFTACHGCIQPEGGNYKIDS